MLEAHHRRGDRDAALPFDRHPVRAPPPPRAARFTSPAGWIAPPNSSNFSVRVVLPASGCEMIAKVRRRAISSVRILINPLQLFPGVRPLGGRSPAPTQVVDMMAAGLFANAPALRTQLTSCF